MYPRVLVTGGAGFIGSYLVDELLRKGNEVVVLDDLSRGRKEVVQSHIRDARLSFHKVDIVGDNINDYFENVERVWHLAANSEVRAALTDPGIDLTQNIVGTFHVSEAMRANNVTQIVFTSSSTVYGEATKLPTPESYGPLCPISVYGATKLSCEALISSYCSTFDFRAVILRLANIIGPGSTHGVIYDFIAKLRAGPTRLAILGDGSQEKTYLLTIA